jgi:hypothetical protein
MAAPARAPARQIESPQMSAQPVRLPTIDTANARQIIAHPDHQDAASVLDACEHLQTYGDRMDRERAKALHATIVQDAVADIYRKGRIQRGMAIAGDLIGAAILFGILYIFLLFTPE